MIRVPITSAPSLSDYYAQLVEGQEAAHGPNYTTHHAVIRAKQSPACCSYAEIGVNQGATLACAILAGFDHVVGVDICLAHLEPCTSLFAGKATLLEQDHLVPLPGPVDFLFLDCAHTVHGLRAELRTHGNNVRRFILVHDTAAVPALHLVAVEWGLRHGFTVQQRECRSVGWTLLSREP